VSNPEQEKIRFYLYDGNLADAYFNEKFREFRESRTLTQWKDLSVKELIKAKEEIDKEILKKLGS
jgi:hypothetical protein